MSTAQWVMLCIGYVGCLGLSFFLSGMETGLTELSRLRLRRKAREGNTNAGRLQDIVDQSEDILWTILVGNTLANFIIFLSLSLRKHLKFCRLNKEFRLSGSHFSVLRVSIDH